MPLLMTDVAAGSNAALQLQQNMAAMPDVQQAQSLAMQQQQANLERTKLANLVADTGIKADQESKQKLMALTQSPEFKAGDDVKKLQMISAKQFELGKVEEGVKTLTASELYQAKDLANQSKQLDNQAREVTKAAAVINSVAPEKIGETFDRLPEANRKVVYDQVGGEQAWKALSNPEKKAVLNNLMMNADRKLAAQSMAIEQEKQKQIAASREKVANISATWHMNNKAAGSSKEELATFRAYINKNATDNKKFTGSESRLVKAISDAKVLYDSAVLTGNTKAAKEAKSEMESRTADLNDLRTRQLKSEISNARMLPAGSQRDRIMDELTKQAEVLGIKTPGVEAPKPDAVKKDTSNKYTQDNPAKPTSKEEYDKLPSGSYYMQDGVLKRKKG